MSRRRFPRRNKAAAIRTYEESSDADSEPYLDDLMLSWRAQAQRPRKKSGPKKNRVPRRSVPAAVQPETTDKSETKDDIDLDTMRKKIGSKIDTIFKDNNLISDEDEVIIEKVDQPQMQSKDFYVLSDSDEEPIVIPIIEKPTIVLPSTSAGTLSDESNKDELMDIVDQILDSDNATGEVCNEADKSWSEYKKKTEEVLNSVSTLLDSIKTDEPNKKISVSERDRSPENKPSCPICLENYGDTVKAATTLCGHIFCYTCINQVAKTTKRCPTCRKIVNAKKFHAVFF